MASLSFAKVVYGSRLRMTPRALKATRLRVISHGDGGKPQVGFSVSVEREGNPEIPCLMC